MHLNSLQGMENYIALFNHAHAAIKRRKDFYYKFLMPTHVFTKQGKDLKGKIKKSKIQKRFYQTSYFPELADVAVIGGGAAGLSAVINLRFEGYRTTLFERRQTGGSYSNTPLIQNVPGFPTGISGYYLSQGASQQAMKLGATCLYNTTITCILKDREDYFNLYDQNERKFTARRIIIASGLEYRKLGLPKFEELENKGIYYEVEDKLIREISMQKLPIVIYGAGNSAGQAAIFYHSIGAKVILAFRGKDMSAHMSQHLRQRINNIGMKILPQMLISQVSGSTRLSSLTLKNIEDSTTKVVETSYLFIMIGGIPAELPKFENAELKMDARGYVKVTGSDNGQFDLSTSIPGVYAAGDITSIGAGRIILAQAQGVFASLQAMNSLDSHLKD